MNNLLERLHASFFFYLLVGTTTFMKIGSFLPSAVLVSTAMLFGGMGDWAAARWIRIERPLVKMQSDGDGVQDAPHDGAVQQWTERSRPIVPTLLVMSCTHVLGIVLFYLCTRSWIVSSGKVRA
jgi:GPI-anchor transamidase subunit GAA1